MVNLLAPDRSEKKAFKNVHLSDINVHPAPRGSLLLDILKTMEQAFQSKGFLPNPVSGSFHPLWFIATSERNNFLWRNGYSLNDQTQFEFWIDIDSLVNKRRYQLELLNEGFSFSNPSWGLASLSGENIKTELSYLQRFQKVTARIQHHVHALSRAGVQLHSELNPSSNVTKVVVLPTAAPDTA